MTQDSEPLREQSLTCFGAPPAGVRRLSASLHLGRDLTVRFRMQGDLAQISVPRAVPPCRAADLWRHTCFELFVAFEGTAAYREFNFSPSGEWAAYEFDSYRSGMRDFVVDPPPAISGRVTREECMLSVALPMQPLRRSAAVRSRVGLAAVLELHDGSLSYWAISHRAMKPDFHRSESFELAIDWDTAAAAAGTV